MDSSHEKRRLQKSRSRKMIAGVCGGIAEYFSIDVTIVRLVWVLATLFGGWGLLAYLAAALIMPKAPEAPAGTEASPPSTPRGESSSPFWGVVLIAVGVLWVAANLGVHLFFPWWAFSWKTGIGILLVVAGAVVLFKRGDVARSASPGGTASQSGGGGSSDVARPERLSRSRRENVIFGVCGGIAAHLDIDPVIVRLAFVVAAFGSVGLMVMIYLILAAVLPLDEGAKTIPVAS